MRRLLGGSVSGVARAGNSRETGRSVPRARNAFDGRRLDVRHCCSRARRCDRTHRAGRLPAPAGRVLKSPPGHRGIKQTAGHVQSESAGAAGHDARLAGEGGSARLSDRHLAPPRPRGNNSRIFRSTSTSRLSGGCSPSYSMTQWRASNHAKAQFISYN